MTEEKEPMENECENGREKVEDENVPSEQVTVSRQDYEDLQKRLQELVGLKEQLQRSAADFDNAKKRLTRERDEFVKFAQQSLVRELLPVLDNFERALTHVDDPKDSHHKKVIAGIRMVQKQLVEILKNQGLKRLESKGKSFDPHLHESIGHVEEGGKEDEVVDEIEAGYLLHDKLLRAAKVRVRVSPSSKAPSKDPGQKPEEIT